MRRLLVLIAMACLLGCPVPPPDPGGSASGPPPPPDDLPVPPGPSGSVCDLLMGGGTAGTGGAGVAEGVACPESVASILEVTWHPDKDWHFGSDGSIFFLTRNLHEDKVRVQFRARARNIQMGDFVEIPVLRLTLEENTSRFTQVDLDFATQLSALRDGSVLVVVEAAVTWPVSTEFERVSDVQVRIQTREDKRVETVTYERW